MSPSACSLFVCCIQCQLAVSALVCQYVQLLCLAFKRHVARPALTSWCELLQADFSSNKFTGKIPSAFSQSEGLVYLNVSRNQLDGIEAAGAWSTPVLVTLDISNNNIAGEGCWRLTCTVVPAVRHWHGSVVHQICATCCHVTQARCELPRQWFECHYEPQTACCCCCQIHSFTQCIA